MELAILGVLICQLSLLLISLIVAKRLTSSLLKNVRSFLESPGEDKQSPLADILDNAANRLAAAIIAHVKAWLLAQNSIAVRQEKAQLRENLQSNAPPMIGALMKFSPGIGKLITKNPELAQLAINYMQNRGGAGSAPEEVPARNNGSSGNPFKV